MDNSELININNNLQYKNKNQKNNNHSYNKVIKINRTYNKESNTNLYKNKGSEKSINVNDFRNRKRYSFNSDSNLQYDNKYNSKSNNNSNNCSFKKFIKFKDGDMQLFNKKNKPISLQTNRIHNNEKIKSRQKYKNKNLNHEYNTTNKVLNRFLIHNINNYNYKSKKSCLNYNKPIRLNYNNDTDKHNNCQDNIDSNSYEKNKKFKHKINNVKKKIGYEGNNDEFIEYLKIIKLKADIIYIIQNMFNEKDIKKCFWKLDDLINDNNYDNENLLNIYQYLAEQLLNLQIKNNNNY